jgi:hypothetical protein
MYSATWEYSRQAEKLESEFRTIEGEIEAARRTDSSQRGIYSLAIPSTT